MLGWVLMLAEMTLEILLGLIKYLIEVGYSLLKIKMLVEASLVIWLS